MAVYIGYYRVNADYQREQGEKARQGNPGVNPAFRQKVIELRDKLPSTIKLLGSYAPLGASPTRPSVWIAETDDPAELVFITNWYQGWLEFEWVPATALGTTSRDTTTAMERNASRR
ncbi:MAG: hypothetical protein R3B97_11395 [Dehalococcoidia bacterium]|nr:hypothetical protein [Dehalococcoidia bacterium]MCB9484555.1 hypothetical protein [Thermoflexaceae bacterium]